MTQGHFFSVSRERIPWIVGITRNGHHLDRQVSAVELAKNYQRLRTAIAENELPCAFERSNVPMEFVLLKEPKDFEDLAGPHTAGFFAYPPSSRLDTKLQLVMDGSTTIHFGPRARDGHDTNWIQTVPGKGWFTILRLYGPLQTCFAKTWRPGEIVEQRTASAQSD